MATTRSAAASEPSLMTTIARALVLLSFCIVAPSHAVQVCELGGQSVNPSNGSTTQGKTGLMRCREADGGPVVREQELKNGMFMGIVRYFKEGVLEREYSVNEKGNREGIAREYAATRGPTNQLLREETLRDGTTVGIARTWYPSGQLKRVSFSDGGVKAMAEFTAKGQLADFGCGDRPLLAPYAADAEWCGLSSKAPSTVTLFRDDGLATGTASYQSGQLLKREWFWPNGKLREQNEYTATTQVRRTFSAEGIMRSENQSIRQGTGRELVVYSSVVKEFHENGKLIHERRWLPPAGDAAALALDQTWYLNGQLREKQEFVLVDGRREQHEVRYHDNGQPAFEGKYIVSDRNARVATGIHKTYYASGRLSGERHYDAHGQVSRERALDEAGNVTRDDELFEDGSRKAYSR